MKARQLVRRFRALGVEIDTKRGKGGHYLAKFGGRSCTIPVHGDKDLPPVFIKKLCKQLGLDPKEIL